VRDQSASRIAYLDLADEYDYDREIAINEFTIGSSVRANYSKITQTLAIKDSQDAE
jgi:hypothetical protein